MRVLALDVSTNTGYAYYEDGKLILSGTIWPDKDLTSFGPYPFNYIDLAESLSKNIMNFCVDFFIGECDIVVEETTASKNNYSQKTLEYLHFCLLRHIRSLGPNYQVSYLRTGTWRSTVGARQTKEERNLNARISRIKKQTGKKLAKIDGKVVGRKDRKDYAIRTVREIFGMSLKKKDNNQADAILLGWAYILGAPACDGTVKGGIIKKIDK
jgi:hypothetical protein